MHRMTKVGFPVQYCFDILSKLSQGLVSQMEDAKVAGSYTIGIREVHLVSLSSVCRLSLCLLRNFSDTMGPNVTKFETWFDWTCAKISQAFIPFHPSFRSPQNRSKFYYNI